jgi:hypothetical protein
VHACQRSPNSSTASDQAVTPGRIAFDRLHPLLCPRGSLDILRDSLLSSGAPCAFTLYSSPETTE